MGVELSQEAVEDARVNALDNGESQRATWWVGGHGAADTLCIRDTAPGPHP